MSLNLNYFFKGPLSKHSHILGLYELELQCKTFGKHSAAHSKELRIDDLLLLKLLALVARMLKEES